MDYWTQAVDKRAQAGRVPPPETSHGPRWCKPDPLLFCMDQSRARVGGSFWASSCLLVKSFHLRSPICRDRFTPPPVAVAQPGAKYERRRRGAVVSGVRQ